MEVTANQAFSVSAAVLWDVVGDFCKLDRWMPGIASITCCGTAVGASRVVTLRSGVVVIEHLLSQDAIAMRQTYTIISNDLPVTGYVASITVSVLANGGCELAWCANFQPASDTSPGQAEEYVGTIFRAGLTGLQRLWAR